MPRTNIVLTVVGVIAIAASIVAGLAIWLLVTSPVAVATAVDSGDTAPLFEAVIGAVYDALLTLVRYL